ncbi:hypothetical protein AGMMS49579_25830 [Spirochaetia bacterium]|nr:hypothetical protein AGMMS49579_25830 [Spirochaetia bacterium]
MSVEGKKDIKLSCDKEVTVAGQNIKLEGSQGITTEGKQLAAEGDKVMGFDVHQMEVPAGTSTAVVPLPHPYMGKLVDNLSDDVKIKGHNAAVKGSKSRHDDAMHMQLPGTIKFVNNPNKEGEVTGGTGSKVKINGKEAAVIGSTVTTCNDVGAKENSAILAAGASIPMPVIINPKNMEEYELERAEQEQKEPEFTMVKWGKPTAKEGEEVELSGQVKDIEDGNMVTFQVWKEGQDPASHIAQAQLPANIEGGTAKVKWSHRPVDMGDEMPPAQDPKFFFTVHSAWCPYKKSGNVTVELKRPELTNPEWQDKDGAGTGNGLVGEVLKMSVNCNSDMEEGSGVTFRVFKEGADPNRDQPVKELGSANHGGKAEAGWTYHYHHDPENPLTEKPKFFFTVNGKRCTEAKSGNAEIGMDYRIIVNSKDGIITDTKCTVALSDGSREEGTTNAEGVVEVNEKVPGVALWVEYLNAKGEKERFITYNYKEGE